MMFLQDSALCDIILRVRRNQKSIEKERPVKRIFMATGALLCVLLSVVTLGCGGGSIGTHLNITDAKALAVLPDTGTKGSGNVLYKITPEGSFILVDISPLTTLVETGSPLVDLFFANATYVILTFGSNIWNPDHAFLVRMTDGTIFNLENIGLPYRNYKGDKPVQSDNSGNIYVRVPNFDNTPYGYANQEIYKIQSLDSDTPSGTRCSFSSDDVFYYLVSGNGTIAYMGWDGNVYLNRLRLANGSMRNIPSMTDNYGYCPGSFFLDFDDMLYFHNVNTNHFQMVQDADVASVTYVDYVGNISQSPGYFYHMPTANTVYKVTQDLDLFTDVYNNTYTSASVAYSTNFAATFGTEKCAAASGRYLYISGYDASLNTVVLKYDPVARTSTETLNTADYDISQMAATSGDLVVAGALRMSDGKKVIVWIPGDGSVVVLDEEHDAEPIALESY